MAKYRATKRFRRNGAWIAPGELVEMPEVEAAKLPKGVIELVAPVKETDAPPPSAPLETTEPPAAASASAQPEEKKK